MYRILGNIYISSIESLTNDDISKYNVTHVLSIVPGHSPSPSCEWLQIALTDETKSNLLGILPASFDFINHCLYGTTSDVNVKNKHAGTILIHCHEGISRSPSVLVCYLIKYYGLSLAQSIHAITRKTGDLNINEGFMNQLRLFESINGDLNSEKYKQFLISNGEDVKSAVDEFNHQKQQAPKRLQDAAHQQTETGFVRCKMCREPLAKSSQMLQHTKPDDTSNQSTFDKKSRNYVYASLKASDTCSHYFLKDPLKWMNLTDELEGKLSCMKCHAKIGGYSWKGSRCSCGKWVVPSFHLQVSKTDFIRIKRDEDKIDHNTET